MRFKVDALPDYPRECPFYDERAMRCRLDEIGCHYFQRGENGIYTEPESCRWLTEEQTEVHLEISSDYPKIDKDFLSKFDKNGFRLKGEEK